MISVKTASGFECEVNEDVLNDIEILEDFQGMANGDVMAVVSTCKKILTPEHKDKLYDHCRTGDGRVPIDVIIKELTEIVAEIPKGKK